MNLRPVEFRIETAIVWDEWREVCLPRLEHASTLKILHLPELEPHAGTCIVVGSGPSIQQELKQIKKLKEGQINITLTLNGAHDWLIKSGAKPNIHIIFEHDIEDVIVALGGPPDKDVTYYICSHCSPKIFEQLEGYNKVLWHAFCPFDGYQEAINKFYPGEFMVGGGYATFFRTLTIAIILGYREFELFGCDSSFEDSSHIDGYATADKEPRVKIWAVDPSTGDKKKFTTQGGFAYQANEFLEFCRVNHSGLRIQVHGNGMMRYLHKSRYPDQYEE